MHAGAFFHERWLPKVIEAHMQTTSLIGVFARFRKIRSKSGLKLVATNAPLSKTVATKEEVLTNISLPTSLEGWGVRSLVLPRTTGVHRGHLRGRTSAGVPGAFEGTEPWPSLLLFRGRVGSSQNAQVEFVEQGRGNAELGQFSVKEPPGS